MLRRLAKAVTYRFATPTDAPIPILKQFGIVNPTILMNLRYLSKIF